MNVVGKIKIPKEKTMYSSQVSFAWRDQCGPPLAQSRNRRPQQAHGKVLTKLTYFPFRRLSRIRGRPKTSNVIVSGDDESILNAKQGRREVGNS